MYPPNAIKSDLHFITPVNMQATVQPFLLPLPEQSPVALMVCPEAVWSLN